MSDASCAQVKHAQGKREASLSSQCAAQITYLLVVFLAADMESSRGALLLALTRVAGAGCFFDTTILTFD